MSTEQLSATIPQVNSGTCTIPRLEKRGVKSCSELPLDTPHGKRWQQAGTKPERT
ncbi:hypothetical protein PDIG_51510 [Penicillium digitatum PHI26]|uniref:Uncharacterized protein n=2 Tax=Penicillium digitatum TaxID=36651 RepID=K9FQ65_PEND2|nr:hypothetical protein PDIP_20710 [Penicillium digitatum Pd1]EKV11314.1 hypothetical protein PDIG_51510 [Penicillium digitatum PHI26]EKV19914.1 hypothetical protein PDIP_20710 [Penicillium digitatum Pd1]